MDKYMHIFRQAPFVRLLIPLMAGITWQNFIGINFNTGYICIILFGLLLLWQVTKLGKNYYYQWIWGAGLFVLLFFFGISLVQQQAAKGRLPLNSPITLKGTVYKLPEEREKTFKLDIQATMYRAAGDDTWKTINEKLILYADKNSNIPYAGDVLICHTALQPVTPPQNPDEFDYRNYMAKQGIFGSSYVRTGGYAVVQTDALPWYRKIPLQIQAYAIRVLTSERFGDNEKAIATALTIGSRQFVDDELKQAYTSAGVIHLLAVSGLHVGIIYWALSLLFVFIRKLPKGRHMETILILLLLWLYAMVVGMSPSVVRATLMFSFYAIGKMSDKPRYTYNFIAASAFISCLFDPYCIFNVGFQLSYSAVLGIIFFQPRIYKLVYFRFKLLNKIWQACSVTLAAQLATLPFILYYFHQFPTYFLPANLLLIIPISGLLYTTLFYFIIHNVPVLGGIVSYVIDLGFRLCNHVVCRIERLPYAIIDGIYINFTQACLLVAIITAIAFYWLKPKSKTIIAILSLFIIFLGIRAGHYYTVSKTRQLTVYNIPNATYIGFMEGRTGFCLRDSSNIDNPFDYQTKNHMVRMGIDRKNKLKVYTLYNHLPSQYNGFIRLGNKTGLFAQQQQFSLPQDKENEPFKIDYLFISAESSNRPGHLLPAIRPEYIIADSSTPRWKAELWKAEAGKSNVHFHYVRDNGAFISNY